MILMVKEIKEQIRHNVLEVDESLSMINSITRLPIATVQRANHSFFSISVCLLWYTKVSKRISRTNSAKFVNIPMEVK